MRLAAIPVAFPLHVSQVEYLTMTCAGNTRVRSSPRPPPSPQSVAAAEAIASEIEDPDLREIVEKAARESLERGRSDRRF